MTDHPILFQGDMVLALMTCASCGTVTLEIECPKCGSKERRKTQTRRVIPGEIHINPTNTSWHWHKPRGGYMECHDKRGNNRVFKNILADRCPYGVPGDLLWVRETFQVSYEPHEPDGHYNLTYLADNETVEIDYSEIDMGRLNPGKKYPSIFMPKWACRLWLKVKSVRVERVQEISVEDAFAEGVCTQQATHAQPYFKALWDSINAKRGYGWEVNPWVWVTEFERYNK